MRKVIRAVAILLAPGAILLAARGQSTWDFAVEISAKVQDNPARITLVWPQDSSEEPQSYTVYRRSRDGASWEEDKESGVKESRASGSGQAGNRVNVKTSKKRQTHPAILVGKGLNAVLRGWGAGIVLPGTATSFVDTNVKAGAAYEYQIVKRTPNYNGYGYIYSGINVPLTENRGRLVLVVDKTYAHELAGDLGRLEQDLVGDGWMVKRVDVDRSDSVTNVKALIRRQYLDDPANTKALFLFGHVPVPYSGDIVPDGHAPDHEGAWPCDGYYGDMDGTWTDDLVDDTRARDARNRNVPGDGKFDQSYFPAPLKLMVGRVDLANMPGRVCAGGPATFPDELELLRNYLNKDHKFRTRQFDVPRRAVVGDYFGARDGEAFAASGWRNFASFFTAANITRLPDMGTWIPLLHTDAFLWAYGCGNGTYTSIEGLGNTVPYHDGVTAELVHNDVKAVFTMLYGSWLGDWDSEDNIQRSVLALPSYSLTCALSGRPHWFLHHMALGAPIGFSTRLTQNNGPNGPYRNEVNSCAGQIHIALMGDPTLRMHPVGPPAELNGASNDAGFVLNWKPSDDSIVGYHVYRAAEPGGPYSRLTSSPISGTRFVDSMVAPTGRQEGHGRLAAAYYMVRAVKLETSASGTYFNPSQGAFLAPAAEPVYTAAPSAKETKLSQKVEVPTRDLSQKPAALNTNTPALLPVSLPDTSMCEPRTDQGPRAMDICRAAAEDERLTPTGNTNTVVWVDDSLPTGAITGADGGDDWNWVSNNPTPYSGTLAHQSIIAAGLHEHYFTWATQTLNVNTGDVLFTYVYLDPTNTPTEVMLQWFSTSWEHRAFWGSNSITYGTNGSAGRQYMGPLPSAGQWVLLQVPASQVGLQGSSVNGMAFSQFGGQATWDYSGDSSSLLSSTNSNTGTTNSPANNPTNSPSSTNTASSSALIDYTSLQPPQVGANELHVLGPNLLELILINTKAADPASVTNWNFVNNGAFSAPSASVLSVAANGQTINVSAIGFKRRPLWAPFQTYDLRIENSLYLELSSSIPTNAAVQVSNPNGSLWPSSMTFTAQANPLRYSPAIHVNQEGYLPNYTKQAMVGYYLGSLGELSIPSSAGFTLVNATNGQVVFTGSLVARPDVGFSYSPTPYQQVYVADFSSFNTPGEYELVVPGLGASLPFSINNGVAMDFARAYALGLYHQRCGTNLGLPYTRFQHGDCHYAPASVPTSATAFPFTWTTVAGYASQVNSENPPQAAPLLTSPAAQLFPYQNQGTVDVSGGHHDAGDYSKYTINSASLVHYLMFEVDSLPGVSNFDNMGLPESGDGISDILQECKWEADFLAKMQDTDGGFYFLVYPQNREYEISVPPNEGDPQVVWPKNSSVTAASVAALAQCASSPAFKKAYPAAAATYLQKAQLGWKFLTNNIAKYGKGNFYQKITFYGDDWADNDEMAWAACQMFLATGDQTAHQDLISWFNPSDPATWRWGWWQMSECWGHAIRSYAFAVQSGRVSSANQLNANFLAACQQQIVQQGSNIMNYSQQSAYGTSFPPETKAAESPGWYFSCDQAFDLAVAYQVNPNPAYISAIIANMNYEGGCNPLNLSYVAGLGWKRQHNFVSQWEINAPRQLPPSGVPVGNIQTAFTYLTTYEGELEELAYPTDSTGTNPMYPFYDRWGDSWNVSTEMVCLNSARALGALAFLAAQTGYSTQAWTAPVAQIIVPSGVVPVGSNVTLTLQGPVGLDLTQARIVWEAQYQQAAFGQTFTFAPVNNGPQWVEAEAQFPDGRRIFATNTFLANSPNIVWFNGAVPAGATTGADGGDAWNWVTSNPTPYAAPQDLQSSVGSGEHQMFFYETTDTLLVGSNSTLYAWVYLNPANPPSEVMLQWYDGSGWEHRAYWGGNGVTFGVAGTVSRYYAGTLPAAGQWVQLQVPASAVGLQGVTVTGMAFTLYGGAATWDQAGCLNPISVPPSLPTVSVATGTNGSRLTSQAGTFTVTRAGGATNAALTVTYLLGGTAVGGSAYQTPASPPSLTIPAGATSATVTINPLPATNVVASQTVSLTLAPTTAYQVGAPASATLALAGNTIPVRSVKMGTNGPTLNWGSLSGKVYCVAYKNNLTDTNWILSSTLTATSTSCVWVDASFPKANQRFYAVAQMN